MTLIDRCNDARVPSPQLWTRAGATSNHGERRSPGAAPNDRQAPHRVTLEANCSPLHARSRAGRHVNVEGPSRPEWCIETVDEAESKPLDASPGDDCSIIGAQGRGRRNKPQPGIIGEARKTFSQPLVGGNAPADYQRMSLRIFSAE